MNYSFVTDCIKLSLYNSIVEITGDDESIDYSKIDAVINMAFDVFDRIIWTNCVDTVKKNLKENNNNEVSDV